MSGSPESRFGAWFDTSVFSVPAPYAYGNESRVDPVRRSTGIEDWDFSLVKDTRFGAEDRIGLQFRTEVFNLFNHPQFGPPNTTVGRQQFWHRKLDTGQPALDSVRIALTF